ncbi:hypothetical protein [Candidatus Poriferisodalis sp.]|uniref:hypothetical protein n=1 Tax=Candidatus Poriferisodalis sp. TaxID=3101277 RepID=UPI003D0A153A
MVAPAPRDISADDFARDPHAAKYRGELGRHPEAYRRLFALLNDRANEQRLVDAEMHGLPALCGVVRFIETDPKIRMVLAVGPSSFRTRQTVGVAVKLKMAKLGWRATGRKGAVKGSAHFTKAERYVADAAMPATASLPASPSSRALAALDAVSAIGDVDEREQTSRKLFKALAATRRSEGRPF